MDGTADKETGPSGKAPAPMTDRERANDYRARMKNALTLVCGIIDDAKQYGQLISFAVADDTSGRSTITKIEINQKL